MNKRWLLVLLVLVSFLPLHSIEYAGFKTEFMNVENTGFYGVGLFTSNKRFDAEVEFFASSRVFDGKSADQVYLDQKYKYFFYSFSGYFHFIRTDTISFYGGLGIFPLLLNSYAYHFTAGMDFYWANNWRAFYNFRYLVNNAEVYRYPSGAAFSAGIKYTWDFLDF